MIARFLIGIDLQPDDRQRCESVVRELGLEIAFETPAVLVAGSSRLSVMRLANNGMILGDLFLTGKREHLDDLSEDVVANILKSQGTRLLEAYWGNYVALMAADGNTAVLRAPFGRLPCLFQREGRGILAASDIDILQAYGKRPFSLDYDEIAWQLTVGDMRRPATALSGISEIQGGSRLTVATGKAVLDAPWTPWTFTQHSRRIDDQDDAVRRLRQTCRMVTASKTATMANPLLLLSGGLDSSIVAACLASDGRNFQCLNMATRDRAGDEREYAGVVASHLARRLIIRPMQVETYEFGKTGAVRLPRPVAKGYEQLIYQAAMVVAAEIGCDGVVDGGGGDNVFCSLRSASPAADCLMDPEGAKHFRRLCDDIAGLAMASHWQVKWRAYRRAGGRRRPHRWKTDDRFLAADIRATAKAAPDHPWLEPGIWGLPGRGAHVANLIAAQGYVEDGPYGSKTVCASPLPTQPLIEHCLAIPSWYWFNDRYDRAAARMAFEGQLPHAITWRRGKGLPDSFLSSLLRANSDAMRSHLLDGILAGAGIIDKTHISDLLTDRHALPDTAYGRLLALVDAESWARGIMAH